MSELPHYVVCNIAPSHYAVMRLQRTGLYRGIYYKFVESRDEGHCEQVARILNEQEADDERPSE
jgi:hypothetical protein